MLTVKAGAGLLTSFNAFRNCIQFIDIPLNVVPGVTFSCRIDDRYVCNPISMYNF